mgnify:CR=1 FL=1
MNNPEVLSIIENLKGRKAYEEKRASKFGFATLYDYIEDKLLKKQANEAVCKETDLDSKYSKHQSKDKTCGCC